MKIRDIDQDPLPLVDLEASSSSPVSQPALSPEQSSSPQPPTSPELAVTSQTSSVPLIKSASKESNSNEPLTTEGLASPEGGKGSSGDSEDEGRYSMDKSE